jgi:hypothetical protein
MMKRNDQDRRRLPAFAYAAGVAAIMGVVGFSALVQSRTQSAEPLVCGDLPVIRAVDAAQGAAPERLKITVVGRRASDLAGALSEVTRAGNQPS